MRRHSILFALAGVGMGAAAVLAVPEYLARGVHGSAQACLGETGDRTVCRFDGGPLEMAGTPVFLEGFPHAFLPTRQQVDFIDSTGTRWTAPPRTLTDGATIPVIFAPLVGDRQSREYLIAAALHDAYCGVGNEALETYRTKPWEDVHRMFYEALLVNGTAPQKAKILFAAVYLGGPRWDDPARSLEGVPEDRLRREMEWCLEWIRDTDPSADDIVAWMRDRETALIDGTHRAPVYKGDPRGI